MSAATEQTRAASIARAVQRQIEPATVRGLIELDACTCLADVTRLAREREQLEAERRAAARERLRVKS